MTAQELYDSLLPYEQWAVRSNLETIRETGVAVEDHVALLRANGYPRLAETVQAVLLENLS